MPVERSAGAIIFRREPSNMVQGKGGKIDYLLLYYPSSTKKPRGRANSLPSRDYWDLPKGHLEKEEKLEDTVRREVAEETGLKDIEFIEGFKETIRYFFRAERKTILKFVTFYLVETKTKDVKISGEHIGFKWLPYKEAIEQLTFKNAKETLEKANQFLEKNVTFS